jgi:hypothetical protein
VDFSEYKLYYTAIIEREGNCFINSTVCGNGNCYYKKMVSLLFQSVNGNIIALNNLLECKLSVIVSS